MASINLVVLNLIYEWREGMHHYLSLAPSLTQSVMMSFIGEKKSVTVAVHSYIHATSYVLVPPALRVLVGD